MPDAFDEVFGKPTEKKGDAFDAVFGATATATADPTDAMSPEDFARHTQTNRPRDAAEAARWTERVNRESPELAKYKAEGTKPPEPDWMDKAATMLATPAAGYIKGADAMRRTVTGALGLPRSTSDAIGRDFGFIDSPRRVAAEEELNKSFLGEVAVAGGEMVGKLPSLLVGAGAIQGALPVSQAARAFPLAMGAQATLETGSLKEGAKAYAFGELGGVFHKTYGAALSRLAPEVAQGITARVASGGLAFGTAGQAVLIAEKIVSGEPVTLDERAFARDVILGAATSVGGVRPTYKTEPRPSVERTRAAEGALREGRDPVAEVNALRLGRDDPFLEPAKPTPVAPLRQEEPKKPDAFDEVFAVEAKARPETGPLDRPAVEPRAPLPTEAEPALGRLPAEKPVPREALPSEPPRPAEGPVTSVKNEIVNRERAARGVEALPEDVVISHEQTLAEGRAILEKNPHRARELIEQQKERPRAIDRADEAVLIADRNRLHLEREAAENRVIKAADDKRFDDVAAAKKSVQEISDQFLEAEMASKSGGRETARSLNARKIEIARDYSLSRMEVKRRIENDGKPLTEKQAAETRALHEQIKKVTAEKDAYFARLSEIEAKRGTRGSMSRTPPGSADFGKTNKVFTKERYEKALASAKEKFARAPAGLDPTLLKEMVEIGGYYIEGNVRSFAAWSKAMLDSFGEHGDKIKPHLEEVYKASRGEASKALRAERTLTDAQRVERAIKSVERSIASHEKRIETGDVFPSREKGPTSPELDALRAKRDALARQVADVRSSVTPKKSGVEAELRAVEKSIAEHERRVATGDVFPQKKGAKSEDPRVTALKARRAELVAIEKDIKASVTPRRYGNEIALQAHKTRTGKRIAELERQIAESDFTSRPSTPIHKDAEAVRLEAKVETVKRAWNEALFRDKLANRTKIQKAAAIPLEAAHFSRAFITSFDISGLGRQGGPLVSAHPKLGLSTGVAMARAFRSAESSSRTQAELTLRPNYHLAKKGGLFLAEHGNVSLTQMEEAFASRWAGKVPGVAGSQRAYLGLNKLRMDVFDTLIGNLARTGTPTPKEVKAVANFINVFTGRGGPTSTTSGFASALANMNSVFFAPRLFMSRFQMLLGTPLYGGSWRTRLLFAKEYTRSLVGAAVVYGLTKAGLAVMGGSTTEDDSRSSDFLKPKIGETRVDLGAGLIQPVVLFSRIITGDTKSTKTGKVTAIRGEDVPYGGRDVFDVTMDFFRGKAAPIAGSVIDLAVGEDVIGKTVTPGGEATDLVTPMVVRDIVQAAKDQGVGKASILGILSMLGIGIQTHEEREEKRRKRKPSMFDTPASK